MQGAGDAPLSPEITALYAIIVVLLVVGAGLMSGLTLGLLSLDVMDLEVCRVVCVVLVVVVVVVVVVLVVVVVVVVLQLLLVVKHLS
jgi:hypothetical protein